MKINFALLFLISLFLSCKVEKELRCISGKLKPKESLYSALLREGISLKETHQICRAFSKKFNLRKSKPGDRYVILKTTYGSIENLKYYFSKIDYYEIKRSTSSRFIIMRKKIPLERKIMGVKGTVSSTLWESMMKQGIPPEIIISFSEIFAWQIDFLTEPRNKDLYKLVWERYQNDSFGVKIDKKILAAEYRTRRKKLVGIRFENSYYDLKGHSLLKQFLRAPLRYKYISSGFSYRRFHPILRIVRPHLGIDYAAPRGTPVVAIGDGIVVYKGWKGGYGRFIKIRHNSIYSSTYGHLWKYARRLRKWGRVKQGQIIGYVGSTGLSTGPHLDFRFLRYGKYVNFLRLKFPPAKKLKGDQLKKFENIKKKRLFLLSCCDSFHPEEISERR